MKKSVARVFDIVLPNDEGMDIRFHGKLITHVTSWNPGYPRWVDLELYQSSKGTLVCSQINHTLDAAEFSHSKIHIADTCDGLIASLGFSSLAKNLYDAAGIQHAKFID